MQDKTRSVEELRLQRFQGDGVMIAGEQIEEESSCIEDLFFLPFYLVIQARIK